MIEHLNLYLSFISKANCLKILVCMQLVFDHNVLGRQPSVRLFSGFLTILVPLGQGNFVSQESVIDFEGAVAVLSRKI